VLLHPLSDLALLLLLLQLLLLSECSPPLALPSRRERSLKVVLLGI
jgi:hypothetical protein